MKALLLLLVSSIALAGPGPRPLVISGGTGGGSGGDASAANQLTANTKLDSIISALGAPLTVTGTGGRSWSLLNSTDSVTTYQGGTWSAGRTWTLSSGTDSVNVGNFPATQAVTVSSGTVTANIGTSGSLATESTLSSINIKLPASLGQKAATGSTSVVLASDQPTLTVTGTVSTNTTLAAETTKIIGTVNMASGQTIGLAAGANAIGKLTANGGVIIGDVNTASDTPGTGATNLGKAEDAPHTSSDVGVMALGVRTDPTTTANTSANGDYGAIAVDYVGALSLSDHPGRFSCNVPITATATTQCQAAPAAGLRAYVTSMQCSNAAATVQGVDIVYGTGAACVTGTTALTHKYQMGTNATTTSPFEVTAYYGPATPLVPVAANAICVRPTAATAFGCTLTGFIAP